MHKKRLLRGALLLLICLGSVLSLLPMQRAGRDAGPWMAGLAEDIPLRALSIPGTHDSGALHSFGDIFGQCQSLSIAEQLAIGVRFLDIRLQLVGDRLKIVHDFVDQKTDFAFVLAYLSDFLRENPSEFLLVSIKEDASPKDATISFHQALEQLLAGYPDVIGRGQALPETVGEARGKMHLIARHPQMTLGLPCGRGWRDSASFSLQGIYIQDEYRVESVDEKVASIEAAMEISAAGSYDMILNFASCYLTGSFPPIYAGIPARQINPWLIKRIKETHGPLGVLICDFMTGEMADTIIGRNFQ